MAFPSTPLLDSQDDVDLALKGTGECFLLRDILPETVKGSDWSVILTDKAFLKLETEDGKAHGSNPVRTRKEILDIHSVEMDAPIMPARRRNLGLPYDTYDPRCFSLYSYKSAYDLQADKMKGVIGLGMHFDSFLQVRRFRCPSEASCFQWVTMLNRLILDQWQRLFEAKLIPAPEIYQHHACVIKLNNHGVSQERVLVFSTDWIYNIEITHNPTNIKENKWCLPLYCLSDIFCSDNSGLTLHFDKTSVKEIQWDSLHPKLKEIKNDYSFLFRDDNARAKTVRELQRLVFNSTGRTRKLLVVVEESEESLKLPPAVMNPANLELRGYFKKLTTSFFHSSVSRYCKFTSSGYIDWSDNSEGDVKYHEMVTSIDLTVPAEIHLKLDPKETARFFTVHTTGKTLQLVASSLTEFKQWTEGIKAVLEYLKH